eukprot:4437584-Lingulodinium_polyedra.AAC.1
MHHARTNRITRPTQTQRIYRYERTAAYPPQTDTTDQPLRTRIIRRKQTQRINRSGCVSL